MSSQSPGVDLSGGVVVVVVVVLLRQGVVLIGHLLPR